MTDRLQELEMEFEKESNRLENCDGMEPFQVLMSIALITDQAADEVLENEHFISLIRASQSNPTETLEILRNLVDLDNQIAELDDPVDNPTD